MSQAQPHLTDDTLVVRCGRPPVDHPEVLHGRCLQYQEVFGFSVQCAVGVSLEELAFWCPNNRIGMTTVGEIRRLGYDVVVTPGTGHHATVVVPALWTVEDAASLVALFREVKNPSRRKAR